MAAGSAPKQGVPLLAWRAVAFGGGPGLPRARTFLFRAWGGAKSCVDYVDLFTGTEACVGTCGATALAGESECLLVGEMGGALAWWAEAEGEQQEGDLMPSPYLTKAASCELPGAPRILYCSFIEGQSENRRAAAIDSRNAVFICCPSKGLLTVFQPYVPLLGAPFEVAGSHAEFGLLDNRQERLYLESTIDCIYRISTDSFDMVEI